MLKKILCYIILIFSCSHIFGQKIFREIKSALKDHNSIYALSLIDKANKDSLLSNNIKIFKYKIDAYIQINDKLNERIYLKEKYDTVSFFNSIYEICTCVSKIDSLENLENRNKYFKSNRLLLSRYYRNLYIGGRYFYLKENYKKATEFLSLSINLTNSKTFPLDYLNKNNQLIKENIALLIQSAYIIQQYNTVIKYEPLILSDTSHIKKSIIETLAETHAVINDTTTFLKLLKEGIILNPQNMYFFTKLSDYYTHKKMYANGLALANKMLKSDSNNIILLTGKYLSLISLKQYESSINVAKKILDVNKNLIEPYYYIGSSYYFLGKEVKLPNSINSKTYINKLNLKRNFYKKALPYLEKYKTLSPTNKQIWGPLLYDIYLFLNMGKEFDAIETIMTK